jgi:hypothetical protein
VLLAAACVYLISAGYGEPPDPTVTAALLAVLAEAAELS